MLKKWMRRGCFPVLVLFCLLTLGLRVDAEEGDVIKNGIYAGEVNLSGMNAAQAEAAVESYVEGLKGVAITLVAAGDAQVSVTAGDLGVTWANREIITQALEVGIHGNVIERYKMLKDLERENLVYPIELSFDLQAVTDILTGQCAAHDIRAVDATLVRENGSFRVLGGNTGYVLDVEASFDKINEFLSNEWAGETCTIPLVITVEEPRGSAEELAKVKDVLGTFTTSYSSSNSNRSANVANGCELINGTLLYPGDEFSTYETVAPFSVDNGYYMAGSYLNGKVVDSLGGGICQVSTTLYNAVLLAELEVTERHNHSMIVSYVDPSADAAIAESSGKDFKFVNNLDCPIYIEGHTENKKITFTIYGAETRDAGRQVRYESEVLEVINPPADTLYADPGQPIGYVVQSSAHIGYKARLWKIVTQGGTEVERTQVNSSSYKMVPRSATIGTATADPVAYEEIMAAIGTSNLDHVKNVIALLTQPQQPEQPQPEAPAE